MDIKLNIGQGIMILDALLQTSALKELTFLLWITEVLF